MAKSYEDIYSELVQAAYLDAAEHGYQLEITSNPAVIPSVSNPSNSNEPHVLNIPPPDWFNDPTKFTMGAYFPRDENGNLQNLDAIMVYTLAHELGHLTNQTNFYNPIKGDEDKDNQALYDLGYAINKLYAQGYAKGVLDSYSIDLPDEIEKSFTDKYNKGYMAWFEKVDEEDRSRFGKYLLEMGNRVHKEGKEAALKDFSSDKPSFKQYVQEFLENLGYLSGSILDFWAPYLGLDRRTIRFVECDPLALDLDGDGIETIAVNDGVLFDHNNDNLAMGSGWLKSDDGFLVFDRNGDGIINNGSELFGDNTLLKNGTNATNGFAALADLDGNGDGKIDANDEHFNALKIWRDVNHDGKTDSGELFTLQELGIASLNLNYQNTD